MGKGARSPGTWRRPGTMDRGREPRILDACEGPGMSSIGGIGAEWPTPSGSDPGSVSPSASCSDPIFRSLTTAFDLSACSSEVVPANPSERRRLPSSEGGVVGGCGVVQSACPDCGILGGAGVVGCPPSDPGGLSVSSDSSSSTSRRSALTVARSSGCEMHWSEGVGESWDGTNHALQ